MLPAVTPIQGETMQNKITGLLGAGAVATLGALGAAQAAPAPAQTDVLRANSYAELLQPIPNAVALLKTTDETGSSAPAEKNIQLARHHHHHHHHHHGRRHHHHHHHHHY
jgi:hypothetical protein